LTDRPTIDGQTIEGEMDNLNIGPIPMETVR